MAATLTVLTLLVVPMSHGAEPRDHDRADGSTGGSIVDLLVRPYRAVSEWLEGLRKPHRDSHSGASVPNAAAGRSSGEAGNKPNSTRNWRLRLRLPGFVKKLLGKDGNTPFSDESPPTVLPAEATGLLDFESDVVRPASHESETPEEPVLDVPPIVIRSPR